MCKVITIYIYIYILCVDFIYGATEYVEFFFLRIMGNVRANGLMGICSSSYFCIDVYYMSKWFSYHDIFSISNVDNNRSNVVQFLVSSIVSEE